MTFGLNGDPFFHDEDLFYPHSDYSFDHFPDPDDATRFENVTVFQR